MQKISTEDLRRMDNREGLIIQGCGGDLDEWVTGINDLLTEAGILINGSKFEHVSMSRLVWQPALSFCQVYPAAPSGS